MQETKKELGSAEKRVKGDERSLETPEVNSGYMSANMADLRGRKTKKLVLPSPANFVGSFHFWRKLRPEPDISLERLRPKLDHKSVDEYGVSKRGESVSRGARHCNRWGSRLVDDLKQAPYRWFWRRFLTHVVPVILGSILGFLLIFLPSILVYPSQDSTLVCSLGTGFNITAPPPSAWLSRNPLSINIAFGHFTFGQVKAIDIAFHFVVGRGLQALLGIWLYNVSTRALTRIMETDTVPGGAFRAITLQDSTFWGIWQLLKYSFMCKGARVRAIMCWLTLAGIFVVIVPTWIGAMGGYIANTEPMINETGTLVALQEIRPVVYIIHDGHRLAKSYTDDYRVWAPWPEYGMYADPLNVYGCEQDTSGQDLSAIYRSNADTRHGSDIAACDLLWSTSYYTSEYGFLSSINRSSIFPLPGGNVSLPPPTLNITAQFFNSLPTSVYTEDDFSWSDVPFGVSWVTPSTQALPSNQQYQPFATSDALFYSLVSGTTYTFSELQSAGTCQQGTNNVTYEWGVSFRLLYAFCATWLAWIVGMTITHADSFLHSRFDVMRRQIGLERAALELGTSIRENLSSYDAEFAHCDQLAKLVGRLNLTYSDILREDETLNRWIALKGEWERWNLRDWLWQEKAWLLLLLLFNTLFVMSWAGPPIIEAVWSGYFSALPGFGIVLLLLCGRKTKGRWLVFAISFIIFLGGNTWWVVQVWQGQYYPWLPSTQSSNLVDAV